MLLGLIGYLQRPAPVNERVAALAAASIPDQPLPGMGRPAAFHWSALESDDYPTYIARLRSVGCPEATIQELISGELETAFAEKRRTLESQFAGNAASLPAAIQKLKQQQSVLLGGLLPPASTTEAVRETALGESEPFITQNASPIAQRRRIPAAVRMPLAFEPGESPQPAATQKPASEPKGGLVLTQAQQGAIQELQASFLQELGDQDPGDPAYLERWVAAQPVLDERLRAELGTDLFNRYQINSFRPE